MSVTRRATVAMIRQAQLRRRSMKATRKLFAHGPSLLLFFTCIAGSQVDIPTHAGFPEDLKVTESEGTRVDGKKQYQPEMRPPTMSEGWLEGIWTGTGYQSNPKQTWTIKFTAQNDTYRIDYPSIPCGGEWKVITLGKSTATFRERLTYGQTLCIDNGTVTIQKLNDTQVAFRFVEPNRTRVTARAVLNRQ